MTNTPDDDLSEYGPDQRDWYAHRNPATSLTIAGVAGLSGVGRALAVGFTPLTYALLGVGAALAGSTVVRVMANRGRA